MESKRKICLTEKSTITYILWHVVYQTASFLRYHIWLLFTYENLHREKNDEKIGKMYYYTVDLLFMNTGFSHVHVL